MALIKLVFVFRQSEDPSIDAFKLVRDHYQGTSIANGGFDFTTSRATIESGGCDLLHFISSLFGKAFCLLGLELIIEILSRILVASLSLLIPVFGITTAMLIVGECISTVEAISIVIIITGLMIGFYKSSGV